MTYRFGPFMLDLSKRRLSRGDELIPLTPKAFDTLYVLVSHAGELVEKDELHKAIWPDTFVEEVTLAQNISLLRKALGDKIENPNYIATVPRRGYRFIESVQIISESATPWLPLSRELEATGSADAPLTEIRTPQAIPQSLGGRSVFGNARFWIAVCAILIGAISVTVIRKAPSRASAPSPVTFSISPPEGTQFSTSGGFMAASPRGRSVAFIAADAKGVEQIWIRSVDSLVERRVAGSDGASQLFWSPDGEHLAFFAGGKLKRVYVAGGAVQTICDTPGTSQPLAGTWGVNDEILFSAVRQPIYVVQARGGVATPIPLTGFREGDIEGWPQFLPDGRHFLFVVQTSSPDRAGLYVGSLDATASIKISPIASYTVYVPDHLLFVDRGSLWLQTFDVRNLRLTGEPSPVAENVAFNAGTLRGVFTASQNGLLAYRAPMNSELAWFGRDGTSLGTIGPPGAYLQFAISPDGRQVVTALLDPFSGTSDIWVLSADGSAARRVTFDRSWDRTPLWSRQGGEIVFASQRDGRWAMIRKSSQGDVSERRLLATDALALAQDWFPDGRLLFSFRDAQAVNGLWVVMPDTNERPQLLVRDDAVASIATLSPNGRWLAHVTYEPRASIFVRSIESPNQRWELSPNGGQEPRWRGDGREVFYLSADLTIMAAAVGAGPDFHVDPPAPLFRANVVPPSGVVGQAYDVTRDGERFLLKVPAAPAPITVITNWASAF